MKQNGSKQELIHSSSSVNETHFITEMGQGLLVPRPGGHSSQVLISRIGKEDVKVSRAVHFEDIFQLLHVQIGPVGANKHKHTVCGSH